jgi:hypothetical protein
MKKILMAATVALCFAGNAFAQEENAGGGNAITSALGNMDKSTIAASAVGLTIAGAIIANNRGSAKPEVIIDIVCGPGEELVDGECVPVSPPITVTSTVTSTVTGTNTVTSTMTTPVTVTASTTSL